MTDMTFVACVPRLSKRTRLDKYAQIYRSSGLTTRLIGWERSDVDTALPLDNDSLLTVAHVGGGYAEAGLGKHYLFWIAKAAFSILRLRPKRIHALGLEGAVAALPARLIFRSALIYDDADRFSLCHQMPSPVRTLVQWTERVVSRLASAHVIPGSERYPDGLPCKATYEVKNNPSAKVLEDSESFYVDGSDDFTVLVTGWLGATRGAAVALWAAEELVDEPVRFVAAGRTTGPDAEAFVALPNVDYRGEVSNAEALALCRSADLVFTMYDPVSIINRFAEPNKWGDCVAVNTPFLVNNEVKTSAPYLAAGAAVSFGYDRPEEAVAQIRALYQSPDMYERMLVALTAIRSENRPFEEQISPLLEQIIGKNT